VVFFWAAEGRLFIFYFYGVVMASLCAFVGCFVVCSGCGFGGVFFAFGGIKTGVCWVYFVYLVGGFLVVFCVALGFVCAH